MIKVSIIIPVYNVEQYLEQCLDSVINQTLKDIEIICVDDKSTDNSLNILRQYQQKDSRIKIIEQQENQGQGVARNIGIQNAKGEYIAFVDPDDWVEYNMCETLYNQAQELDSEVVIFEYDRYKEKNGKFLKSGYVHRALEDYTREDFEFPVGVDLDKKYIDDILLVVPHYSWNKLYKRELLLDNNLKFDSARAFEDVIFVLKAFLCTKKISYTNENLYHYRIRQTSTLRAKNSHSQDVITILEEIEEFLKENKIYEKYKHNFQYFIICNLTKQFKLSQSKQVKFLLYETGLKYLEIKEKDIFKNRLYPPKFSITYTDKHKVINILGIKFKWRVV